jgi:hypothetical protein
MGPDHHRITSRLSSQIKSTTHVDGEGDVTSSQVKPRTVDNEGDEDVEHDQVRRVVVGGEEGLARRIVARRARNARDEVLVRPARNKRCDEWHEAHVEVVEVEHLPKMGWGEDVDGSRGRERSTTFGTW